jgi:hypothetical protein
MTDESRIDTSLVAPDGRVVVSAASLGSASFKDDVWALAFAAALLIAPVAAHVVIGDAGPSWLAGAIAAAIAVAGYTRRPVPALLIIALYLLFIDTIELAAGPGVKVVDELTIPLVAIITLARGWREVAAAWSWPREAGVLLIAVAAVASSLVNGVAPLIWLPGLVLLAKGFAMFYVARLLPISDLQVRWAMRIVLGVGIVVLVLGAIELAAPDLFTNAGLRPSDERAGLPAVKSLFFHPQLFAWFSGFIALFLIAHHGLLRQRWMLGLAILFSIATILSARRRAMLSVVGGFLAGIVVDLLGSRRAIAQRFMRWAPAALSLLIVSIGFLPALIGLYQLTVDRYMVGGGVSGSFDIGPIVVDIGSSSDGAMDAQGAPARVALYQASVLVARDHFPLGAGLGRFGSWMSRTNYSDVYYEYGLDEVYGLSPDFPTFVTDTFWPQVLGEMGLVGLIGYAIFLTAVGASLAKLYQRVRASPAVAAVVLGAGMILAQTLVESLASPIFNSPPQVYLIMLTLGGVLSWQRREAAGAATKA